MTLRHAEHYAEKIAEWLGPVCLRIEVAGSIRRRRPVCNDVDLVVVPKVQELRDMLGEVVERRNQVVFFLLDYIDAAKSQCPDESKPPRILAHAAENPAQIIIELPKCQLDIWFAGEDNWGSVLLCRTGSKAHNIWLCQRANDRGLHWRPPEGLFDAKGHLAASRTEQEIFQRLGLDFIPPERRER